MARVHLCALFLAASLGPTLAAQSSEPISLTIDATQTQQKLLHGKLVIPVKPGPLTLYYPKWIPGEHGPDGPVANLTGLHFKAVGKEIPAAGKEIPAAGKEIPWTRDTLDVYTFHLTIPAGATQLEATYDFIEAEGYSATDKLTVLEWNEALLYPAGTPSNALTYNAKLILPKGWKYGTALPVANESAETITFKPISLELLVDSPVIAGQYYRSLDLTPPGEPIHHEIDLVADSEAALAMSPETQKKLTAVVAESGKLFGARHYRDYHFLLTLSDHVAHFGLEHHESNDSRLPERILISPGGDAQVGALLPHEFVHSWNGKYRRPADIATPDFQKPMQDELLWGYEGLTEFLGPLLAVRSGLFTPVEYREFLAYAAGSLGPGRPGRTWRPLVDTATSIAGSAGPGGGGAGWLSWRRAADYYDEGDMMWLEVSAIIARESKGQKSIDDFCHAFHGGTNDALAAGPHTNPYTFEQLVETLNKVVPYDWAAFFHEHVESTKADTPDGGIKASGWKLIYNETPLKFPGRRGTPNDIYSLGLDLREDGTVNDSVVGSPAFKAGISSGMRVVGVNDRIYTRDLLSDAIQSAKTSSTPINLLVTSDGYYRQAKIDYTKGPQYPHLVREESTPNLLDEIAKPRTN